MLEALYSPPCPEWALPGLWLPAVVGAAAWAQTAFCLVESRWPAGPPPPCVLPPIRVCMLPFRSASFCLPCEWLVLPGGHPGSAWAHCAAGAGTYVLGLRLHPVCSTQCSACSSRVPAALCCVLRAGLPLAASSAGLCFRATSGRTLGPDPWLDATLLPVEYPACWCRWAPSYARLPTQVSPAGQRGCPCDTCAPVLELCSVGF